MTDLRDLVRRWNEASRKQLGLRNPAPSAWPLVGMFAMGLMAGAMGFYAVTQRTHIRRLAGRAVSLGNDWLGELGRGEAANPGAVVSHRSNHRRKAAAEANR